MNFSGGGSLRTPKIGKQKKIKLQITIFEDIKFKKRKWGVFHRRNRSQNFRFSK